MIYELNHFGIVVKDLQKSLDFYQDALGARNVFQSIIPSTQTDVVYLQIGGGLIELLHRADAAARREVRHYPHRLHVDDLDGDYARLMEAGYEGS